jgi:regulator of replication initiation timing
MIKRILLITAFLMFMAGPNVFGQEGPQDVHQKVSSAITTEENAQNQADDWNADKERILDEIRDLKYRITWLQYRQEKNKIYIKEAEQNIEDLEFEKAEINKLREQLEPYLEEVVERLETFIADDLPFLPDERQSRLDILWSSLNNYSVALSEKLRRVLEEGLQIETQYYGQGIEAIEDETLNIGGSDTQVTFFRLGRLMLLYMSIDGTQVGRYNNETKEWEALPENLTRNVSRILDIAQRKRTAEIVELPVGAL